MSSAYLKLKQEELLKGDEKIVAEAQRRFEYCEKYESHSRQLELDDIKFVHGNSDNHFQWPNEIRARLKNKAILTVNKTRQHNLQIINDAKQNKPAIKFRPVGNGATFEAANVLEGISRYIEYNSNAQAVYGHAISFQVNGGVGYWRVVTDYAHDNSFDQDIFIRRIKDPQCVYIDPDTKEVDGLDAKFAFIFDDMPEEVFKEEFPDYEDVRVQSTLETTARSWVKKDTIRVAEYFRVVKSEDTLFYVPADNGGEGQTMRASETDKAIVDVLKADDKVTKRPIDKFNVEWYLIAGDKIIDQRDWAGVYIPIVKLVGEELEIDGELHRAGHTRYLKDPQRMYNYWTSSATDAVALQTKTPWVAPKQAVKSTLNYWKNSNNENYAVLVYDHMDEKGNPIPPPTRPEAPAMPDGYLKGMATAAQELMMASGQYQAMMGEQGNEVSGKAINERQRQGDRSTYHFTDQQAISITATGKIILDLIPKVYDTKRVVKILGEDGTQTSVQIDPSAQQAYAQKQSKTQEEVAAIFNPNVGKYSVYADIGPAYATQRQEAWNAITQLISSSPELTMIVGDLLFKNADFKTADEIAERLERMVPPQAKGVEGQDPQVIALNHQLQTSQTAMGKLMEELAAMKMKLSGKEQQKEIDAYDALTGRIDVLLKHHNVTPKDFAKMLHDVMMEQHRASLQPVVQSADDEIERQDPGSKNEQTATPSPAGNASATAA